jgi:hypothetical protein
MSTDYKLAVDNLYGHGAVRVTGIAAYTQKPTSDPQLRRQEPRNADTFAQNTSDKRSDIFFRKSDFTHVIFFDNHKTEPSLLL